MHSHTQTGTHCHLNTTKHNPQILTQLLYVLGKYKTTQTGVRYEIPEFSKCLTAHKSGAKTTDGQMIQEN